MPRGQGHDAPEGEPDLTEIEAALGSLAPSRGRVDRDLVMYQAGRASARAARSGRRGWMAVAASLGLVALGEAALLARRPPERVVERLVVVREPAPAAVSPAVEVAEPPPSPSPELGPGSRDRLAWQVLRYGLDGLPAPGPSAGADREPSRQSLREELGKVLDLGDPS
jgi:hypothetical protein